MIVQKMPLCRPGTNVAATLLSQLKPQRKRQDCCYYMEPSLFGNFFCNLPNLRINKVLEEILEKTGV